MNDLGKSLHKVSYENSELDKKGLHIFSNKLKIKDKCVIY
jgi:hypothetical protein